MIEVPGTYTLLSMGKEASRMASALLGKYASITAVDLIQQKKLDYRNFYDSNLTEARFDNSLLFYQNNDGIDHYNILSDYFHNQTFYCLIT